MGVKRVKKILVCGSRNYTGLELIEKTLRQYKRLGYRILIHGGASGADRLADIAGFNLGYQIHCFPADWEKYGRAAGPIRNQKMMDEGKPDRVLAFSSKPYLTTGTADMVRISTEAGVPVKVFLTEET